MSVSIATRGIICSRQGVSIATRGFMCLIAALDAFIPTFVVPSQPSINSEMFNKEEADIYNKNNPNLISS